MISIFSKYKICWQTSRMRYRFSIKTVCDLEWPMSSELTWCDTVSCWYNLKWMAVRLASGRYSYCEGRAVMAEFRRNLPQILIIPWDGCSNDLQVYSTTTPLIVTMISFLMINSLQHRWRATPVLRCSCYIRFSIEIDGFRNASKILHRVFLLLNH